jgi:polyhydroxyalkanoate synthesis regulator phasin
MFGTRQPDMKSKLSEFIATRIDNLQRTRQRSTQEALMTVLDNHFDEIAEMVLEVWTDQVADSALSNDEVRKKMDEAMREVHEFTDRTIANLSPEELRAMGNKIGAELGGKTKKFFGSLANAAKETAKTVGDSFYAARVKSDDLIEEVADTIKSSPALLEDEMISLIASAHSLPPKWATVAYFNAKALISSRSK